MADDICAASLLPATWQKLLAAVFCCRAAGVRGGKRAPTPSQKQALARQAKEDQAAAEHAARRERAAAAAEARMQAITLASQQQQLHH